MRAVRVVRACFFGGIHIHRPLALLAQRSHSPLCYKIWTVPALPCRVCGACCVPLTSRFARGACRAAVRAVLWVRVACRGCRVASCRATPCARPSSPSRGHVIIGNACCAPRAPCGVGACVAVSCVPCVPRAMDIARRVRCVPCVPSSLLWHPHPSAVGIASTAVSQLPAL